MNTRLLIALFLAAATVLPAQIVVTSTTGTINPRSVGLPGDSTHYYDYIVSYGFGGVTPPSFQADFSAHDEFTYRVNAPGGLLFTVEVPATGALQYGWIVPRLSWSSAASDAPWIDFGTMTFEFHDYAGPGFGQWALPIKIREDGTAINMEQTGIQFLPGEHTFSGFSLTTGYGELDTTGWVAGSYAYGQFWVNYYIAMAVGEPAPPRLDLTTATTVPEPSTYALIVGSIMLGVALWRRLRVTAGGEAHEFLLEVGK